jgi:hypothetical protein
VALIKPTRQRRKISTLREHPRQREMFGDMKAMNLHSPVRRAICFARSWEWLSQKFHAASTRVQRSRGSLVRMSDPVTLPTPDEIAERIRACRAELAALKRLQRLVNAEREARNARARRQGRRPARPGGTP